MLEAALTPTNKEVLQFSRDLHQDECLAQTKTTLRVSNGHGY